eukprot:357664-Chlamydomonas_euryale.AAC.5
MSGAVRDSTRLYMAAQGCTWQCKPVHGSTRRRRLALLLSSKRRLETAVRQAELVAELPWGDVALDTVPQVVTGALYGLLLPRPAR